jgi:hypothetical protein
LAVTAKGNIKIEELSGEIKTNRNVLYVPGVKSNLLSIGKFIDLGHVVLFNSTHCLNFDHDQPDKIFLRAFRDSKSKLYKVQSKLTYPTIAAILQESSSPRSSSEFIPARTPISASTASPIAPILARVVIHDGRGRKPVV